MKSKHMEDVVIQRDPSCNGRTRKEDEEKGMASGRIMPASSKKKITLRTGIYGIVITYVVMVMLQSGEGVS